MRNKILLSSLLAVAVLFTAFKIENNKYFEITKNLEIFSNLYKELNTNYVDELDPGQLMKVGIDAMMQSLDPYTVYWSGTQIEGYKYQRNASYKGMGATFEMLDGNLTVTEIFKDHAAHNAGLIVGDQIKTLNNIDIEGKEMEEIELFMMGTPGTSISFGILHPGSNDLENIDVIRSSINQSNVPHYQIIDKDIAYVNLSTFTQLAGRNIQGAIRKLKTEQKDIKGVVLDLRNNGGGLLLEAVNVSNLFIPKGEVVVSTRGKVPEWDRTFKTLQEPYEEELPLAVLINGSSASASEIVAGVIQDLDRGVLVGQRSYGKGLVQNTKELGYNARTKITTSKYFIPSDRCIQSVQYENGEPKDISDEERATFYTKAGRPVKDGGGISPDINIEKKEDSELITALKKQHIVFNFATKYLVDPSVIIDSAEYNFKDYNRFIDFVKEEEFTFSSSTELKLEELIANAESKALPENFMPSLKKLQNDLQSNLDHLFEVEKEEITALIEEELVARKHFEKGRITYHLKKDEEVKQAIDVLRDNNKYNEILKK